MIFMDKLWESKIWRLQFDEKSVRIVMSKIWDARFKIFALEWKETIPENPYEINAQTPSYISFHIHENSLKFSWVYVAPELRGTLISDYFISLLFTISEQMKIPFHDTSIIRKPIMAKKLMEWWFIPKNLDTQVELTGISIWPFWYPVVKNVQDTSGRLKHNISKFSENVFYILSDIEEGTGEIMPIHTGFTFENWEKYNEKIEKLSHKITWKNRFYKTKVAKILGEKS